MPNAPRKKAAKAPAAALAPDAPPVTVEPAGDPSPPDVDMIGARAELVDLDSVYPDARNTRIHSEEQKVAQAAAMRKYGWTMPMLLRARDNPGLIAGHLRWEVGMERLGLKQGPAIFADGWTEEMIRAYVIWDNRSAEMSTWDLPLLKLEVGELQEVGFDLGLVGFTLDDIAGMDGLAPAGDAVDPIGQVPDGAYREQFGVVVVCKDEPEQQAVYERLRDEGLNVKVVKV